MVIGDMIRFFLPTTHSDQEFIVKNMGLVASGHHHIALISMVTLFISCTGIFLPLEVALNQVWGVTKSRSYLMNQVVSIGLAVLMVFLATCGGRAGRHAAVRHRIHLHGSHRQPAIQGADCVVAGSHDGAGQHCHVLLHLLAAAELQNSRRRRSFLRRSSPAWCGSPASSSMWRLLPHLDLRSAYGPFETSVGLMMWAYVSGLLLLGGAHYSAARYTRRLAQAGRVAKWSRGRPFPRESSTGPGEAPRH